MTYLSQDSSQMDVEMTEGAESAGDLLLAEGEALLDLAEKRLENWQGESANSLLDLFSELQIHNRRLKDTRKVIQKRLTRELKGGQAVDTYAKSMSLLAREESGEIGNEY